MPMENTITLQEYIRLTKDEKEIFESLDLISETKPTECCVIEQEPSQNTINNILNYSKALSIRKSRYLENVEMILN